MDFGAADGQDLARRVGTGDPQAWEELYFVSLSQAEGIRYAPGRPTIRVRRSSGDDGPGC